jgi:hypothetical protein
MAREEATQMATTMSLGLHPDKEYEVVAGQPEEKTMGGARHGGVGARLIVRLGSYVEAHQLVASMARIQRSKSGRTKGFPMSPSWPRHASLRKANPKASGRYLPT